MQQIHTIYYKKKKAPKLFEYIIYKCNDPASEWLTDPQVNTSILKRVFFLHSHA